MPFLNKIPAGNKGSLFFWNITESVESLSGSVVLSKANAIRLGNFKSEKRRKSFLAAQHLIGVADIDTQDVFYDKNGKPLLKNGGYISISHSADCAVLAVSDEPIGVDMEGCREQLLKIKHKFLNPDETWVRDTSDLTRLWCLKEASYKLLSLRGLSFKNSIIVTPKKNDFFIDVNSSKYRYSLKGICFGIGNFICSCVTHR